MNCELSLHFLVIWLSSNGPKKAIFSFPVHVLGEIFRFVIILSPFVQKIWSELLTNNLFDKQVNLPWFKSGVLKRRF